MLSPIDAALPWTHSIPIISFWISKEQTTARMGGLESNIDIETARGFSSRVNWRSQRGKYWPMSLTRWIWVNQLLQCPPYAVDGWCEYPLWQFATAPPGRYVNTRFVFVVYWDEVRQGSVDSVMKSLCSWRFLSSTCCSVEYGWGRAKMMTKPFSSERTTNRWELDFSLSSSSSSITFFLLRFWFSFFLFLPSGFSVGSDVMKWCCEVEIFVILVVQWVKNRVRFCGEVRWRRFGVGGSVIDWRFVEEVKGEKTYEKKSGLEVVEFLMKGCEWFGWRGRRLVLMSGGWWSLLWSFCSVMIVRRGWSSIGFRWEHWLEFVRIQLEVSCGGWMSFVENCYQLLQS